MVFLRQQSQDVRPSRINQGNDNKQYAWGEGSMIITNAVLVVANNKIVVTHELLADIKLHLTVAIALSKAYTEIWRSIYWNDASTQTKKRVNEKLNRLAFDIKTSILDALGAMDKYCDLMEGEPCPRWFTEMSYDIQEALKVLNKEHKREVDCVQLKLLN
jgi:hypothetical protein